MFQGDRFTIVGFTAIFKGKSNVLRDRRLVVFSDKDIMSRTRFDQITGQFALCQQCIAGDGFTVDIERSDHWDEHPNFIGLFEHIMAFYRQGTDFFWV